MYNYDYNNTYAQVKQSVFKSPLQVPQTALQGKHLFPSFSKNLEGHVLTHVLVPNFLNVNAQSMQLSIPGPIYFL